MNDEDEDVYSASVTVTHPDRPTATLKLSWAEEKDDAVLVRAINDLAVYVVDVSRKMAGVSDG